MNVTRITNERLGDLSFDIRSTDDQRAYVTQDGLRSIAANDHTVGRLRAARDRARDEAIKNLARYKFSNFGYQAARWVTLNAIIGDKAPNPFRALVLAARRLAEPPRRDA